MSEVIASTTGGEGATAAGAAATTATTTATAGGAAASTTTPTAPSWLEGADEITVGYVANKGWQEPKQAIESYRNLEKLMGADKAGNAVVLPKADAAKPEMDAFYNRLGRPAEPAGYGLEKIAGADPEFSKTAGGWFHELGLTQKQGEALATKWSEHVGGLTTAGEEAKTNAFAADDVALKASWGQAFAQNVAAAQAGARGLGLDNDTIDKLQGALGHKGTMELLHKIGSKVGESDFITGDNLEKFGNALTPGQAKAKIQERMSDKSFTTRYLNKDAEAVAEMKRLHEHAYPE